MKIAERQHSVLSYKALQVDPTGTLVNNDSRTISGYAAIFNNIDGSGDVLLKGCFAKSINDAGPGSKSNRKISLLWQHDISNPLGRIKTLYEDDHGLYFEAEIDNIPEGDRAILQMKSGTINQFSIGYQYVQRTKSIEGDGWDSDDTVTVVSEVKLFEISCVTIGCNEETEFLGMKAAELETQQNGLVRDIERELKAIPDYATSYRLRQLFKKTMALDAAMEPLQSTPIAHEPPQTKINTSHLKFI